MRLLALPCLAALAAGCVHTNASVLDPTVSRQHARITFAGQRWHLFNMSTTNAVLLNGAALPDHGSGITLQDGDRLEMGAVVFVFHAR